MVNALSDVDGSILDCKKSIEEFDNELLSLHTEIFDRIQEQFSNLDSEISNIIDLFDEFDVSDDKGMWSKEGIAQLGLLTQQYELAQHQVQQYNDEIDELNKQYLNGKYSATEYADKLADLNAKQWDAVKSSESAKDAVLKLNEARVENAVKGIEKEIESYKELIDAQQESLNREKALRDYKNDIADKTKTVSDIERQLAAMANDNSQAATAKKKLLQQQLADAKAELEEAEYDHSIESQQEALNKQYENYEKERNDEIESLKASLNDKETILADSFNTVKENASLVGQEIAQIAVEHGITISNALISSWQSGEDAVAAYGEILSQNTSAFIGNIMGVENEVWNLQAQANNTANSLAWMFSAKADNLVNELTASYYSEVNLANMTNALQQSLINTLERGYNVNGITSALSSIESAANSAKAAIDALNNTPSTGGYSGGSGSNNNFKPTNDTSMKSPYTYGDYSETTNNASKAMKRYMVLNSQTGDVLDRLYQDHNPTSAELQAMCKRYKVPSVKVQAYANGTRNAEDEIRIVDEKGKELILTRLTSGRYDMGNKGDQIFTKEQTDRLYELANTDPKNLAPFKEMNLNAMQQMWRNAKVFEPVVNRKATVPVTIDNRTIFNGDVNDLKHLKEQMQKIADKSTDNGINKFVRKINDIIIYG